MRDGKGLRMASAMGMEGQKPTQDISEVNSIDISGCIMENGYGVGGNKVEPEITHRLS